MHINVTMIATARTVLVVRRKCADRRTISSTEVVLPLSHCSSHLGLLCSGVLFGCWDCTVKCDGPVVFLLVSEQIELWIVGGLESMVGEGGSSVSCRVGKFLLVGAMCACVCVCVNLRWCLCCLDGEGEDDDSLCSQRLDCRRVGIDWFRF